MPEPAAIPVVRVRGLVSRFGAQVVHDGLDMEVQGSGFRMHPVLPKRGKGLASLCVRLIQLGRIICVCQF